MPTFPDEQSFLFRLQESNSELRGKSNASSTELITLRSQLNEAKSMMALKESQVRELDEKCKDSKRLYETETERWRTKYDEVSLRLNAVYFSISIVRGRM